MRLFGNIIWFIFGGWILALSWLIGAVIFACTIIGLPVSRSAFEIAKMSAFPFGKEVVHIRELDGKGLTVTTGISGPIGFIFNILWFLIFGIALFFLNLAVGLVNMIIGIIICCTIILIPLGLIQIAFGVASLKLATVSLWPVGRRVVSKELAQAAKQRNAERQLDSMSGTPS